MRKLIEYNHLSIDGRMSGDAWWAGQMKVVPDDNHFAYRLQLLSSAIGLVLGRATYEGFAQSWPTMTGDVADKIDSLPKHVASTTLTETTWNARVLADDAVEAVARLKEAGDGRLLEIWRRPVQPGAGRGRSTRRTASEDLPPSSLDPGSHCCPASGLPPWT
ncbi:hypothetical protein [Nonomuraea bangladeshensis]|uniref:dihydrofolate reductase family protein n=1 Tax=Nonomuraea bangladeshensis TaxID=404385 RepID=UPI0031DFA906